MSDFVRVRVIRANFPWRHVRQIGETLDMDRANAELFVAAGWLEIIHDA